MNDSPNSSTVRHPARNNCVLRADQTARVDRLKSIAHGHWTEILRALGVSDAVLSGRNGPCPRCGGTDRFVYTDRYQEGNYHCRGCGTGGGLKLLQAAKDCDFMTALKEVEQFVGVHRLQPTSTNLVQDAAWSRKLAQRIWDESRPLAAGDEACRYLASRGLALPTWPSTLRFHPALAFYEKDGGGKTRKIGEHPAMVALVQDVAGQPVTLHRTYLCDGGKLPSPDARKLLSAGINGSAVQLQQPTDLLAVGEGIETMLAVHRGTKKPVWSAISAVNLEKFIVPPTVRRLHIYADNDADGDFAGQAAAFALARRIRMQRLAEIDREVKVFLPMKSGADWADVWLQRGEKDHPRRAK